MYVVLDDIATHTYVFLDDIATHTYVVLDDIDDDHHPQAWAVGVPDSN